MDEHLHSNVDKPITDTLRNQKYDLSEEVWNKIDDELNNEDKAVSTRHHQQQVKNSIWTILFFMIVIGVTTFQFRKSQSTANIHSPVNHTPSDSKISDSVSTSLYPLTAIKTVDAFKQGLLLTKKSLLTKKDQAFDVRKQTLL